MIQIKILQERYSCRTKDLFWYKEMRLAVELIVKEKKTLADIRWLSEQTNLYNAASSSRANEIRVVIARRINAVNDNFLEFYHNQTMDVQKILTVIMIMLTDRTFFEFMNLSKSAYSYPAPFSCPHPSISLPVHLFPEAHESIPKYHCHEVLSPQQ